MESSAQVSLKDEDKFYQFCLFQIRRLKAVFLEIDGRLMAMVTGDMKKETYVETLLWCKL